jgi:hypothetical protein
MTKTPTKELNAWREYNHNGINNGSIINIPNTSTQTSITGSNLDIDGIPIAKNAFLIGTFTTSNRQEGCIKSYWL